MPWSRAFPFMRGAQGDRVETRLEEGAVEAKWQQEVPGQPWVLKSLKSASGENLKELSPPPGSAALAPDLHFHAGANPGSLSP